MMPELGQLALAVAFCLSVAIAWFGLVGAATGRGHWVAALGSMVTGQFVFMLLAFLLLTYAFMSDDFSVAYVANNSNTLLPWYYKFSAVWGAHEGSFLLWVLIMAGWTLAVACAVAACRWTSSAGCWASWGCSISGFWRF
jgi:cytochrome c-type biogenesis protein CcmF